MDCVGRNWPLAGPAHTPNKIEAPTHKPPASHRHRPRLREHSHSSSVFTGCACSSRSSTSAKLRAGGRGDGNGECESSQVVSGDAVRQSPGSTPLGRSIFFQRRRRRLRQCSARLRDSWRRPASPRSPRTARGRSRWILPICSRRPRPELLLRYATGPVRRCSPLATPAVGEAPLPSGVSGTPSVRVRLGQQLRL